MKGTDSLSRLRAKQLSELNNRVRNVERLDREGNEWRVSIPYRNLRAPLHIVIDESFPSTAPRIRLMMRAQHAFLDQFGYVTAPDLLRWTPHSNLGRVVDEIIKTFLRQPPQFMVSTQGQPLAPMEPQHAPDATMHGGTLVPGGAPQGSLPLPPPVPRGPAPPSQQQLQQQPARAGPGIQLQGPYPPPYPSGSAQVPGMQRQPYPPPRAAAGAAPPGGPLPPPVPPQGAGPSALVGRGGPSSAAQEPPQSFAFLDTIEIDEIESLQADPKLRREKMMQLPDVKNIVTLLENVSKANQGTAAETLQQEPQLAAKRERIDEIKKQMQVLGETFRELADKQQTILAAFRPDVVLRRVVEETNTLDERSEDLADEFAAASERDLPDKLEQYLALRKKYHRLNCLRERYVHPTGPGGSSWH